MNREVIAGRLLALSITPNLLPISHLFFSDDVVIAAAATVQNCRTLLAIIQSYCSFSGQAANKSKSRRHDLTPKRALISNNPRLISVNIQKYVMIQSWGRTTFVGPSSNMRLTCHRCHYVPTLSPSPTLL